MATVAADIEIDWMACELIESVPGKVSGRVVVVDTRIMPDAILHSYELGDSIDEIHEGFPTLSIAQIKDSSNLAWANSNRAKREGAARRNLDRRLRRHLGIHEVFPASYKGWAGLKNGKLLQAAEDDGIEVLLTGDQTPSSEQNLSTRRLAIVVLSTVEWRIFKDYLPQIAAAIHKAIPGSFQEVECGTFSRKRTHKE